MKIGDLVEIINEWTVHNPWMIFPDDDRPVGLVTSIGSVHDAMVATVLLLNGHEVVVSTSRCEVLQ